MTGTQVMALIIIGIVVAGICIGSAIGAWKEVKLAKYTGKQSKSVPGSYEDLMTPLEPPKL